MKTSELLNILNQHVPFSSAESWDNVGLLIGDKQQEITGILTALDCTMEVLNEAIEKDINTIVAHHPLIFKGVKSINEQGYGAIIRRLIQNNIQLIALHTNLDVYRFGVNAMLSKQIGLTHTEILDPQQTNYYKVLVFIPEENVEKFKNKMNDEGFASEGDYEYCFFSTKGSGQFKPVENAHPHIGELDQIETVEEVKVEFMIQEYERTKAEDCINVLHPYETPVYDFIPLTKTVKRGLGMIGQLPEQTTLKSLAMTIKKQLDIPSVRFTGNPNTVISKAAIIGGSGIGYEKFAHQKGADVFITGDIKHHDALDAETEGYNLIDINHYSEYVMKEGLKSLLKEWISNDNLTIEASTLNTDPFNYV